MVFSRTKWAVSDTLPDRGRATDGVQQWAKPFKQLPFSPTSRAKEYVCLVVPSAFVPDMPSDVGTISHRLSAFRSAQLDQRIREVCTVDSDLHVSRLQRAPWRTASYRTSSPAP